jgi:hypothetical protein
MIGFKTVSIYMIFLAIALFIVSWTHNLLISIPITIGLVIIAGYISGKTDKEK